MEVGSGPLPLDVTHNLTFEFLIQQVRQKKFDPEGEFIKKYVPELDNLSSKLIHEPWKIQDLLEERI